MSLVTAPYLFHCHKLLSVLCSLRINPWSQGWGSQWGTDMVWYHEYPQVCLSQQIELFCSQSWDVAGYNHQSQSQSSAHKNSIICSNVGGKWYTTFPCNSCMWLQLRMLSVYIIWVEVVFLLERFILYRWMGFFGMNNHHYTFESWWNTHRLHF